MIAVLPPILEESELSVDASIVRHLTLSCSMSGDVKTTRNRFSLGGKVWRAPSVAQLRRDQAEAGLREVEARRIKRLQRDAARATTRALGADLGVRSGLYRSLSTTNLAGRLRRPMLASPVRSGVGLHSPALAIGREELAREMQHLQMDRVQADRLHAERMQLENEIRRQELMNQQLNHNAALSSARLSHSPRAAPMLPLGYSGRSPIMQPHRHLGTGGLRRARSFQDMAGLHGRPHVIHNHNTFVSRSPRLSPHWTGMHGGSPRLHPDYHDPGMLDPLVLTPHGSPYISGSMFPKLTPTTPHMVAPATQEVEFIIEEGPMPPYGHIHSHLGVVEGHCGNLHWIDDGELVEAAIEDMIGHATARGANGVVSFSLFSDELGQPVARGEAVYVA
ncbi:hypothetical protein ACM66B_001057 [Microbotryomycetes sp. NB124-2]